MLSVEQLRTRMLRCDELGASDSSKKYGTTKWESARHYSHVFAAVHSFSRPRLLMNCFIPAHSNKAETLCAVVVTTSSEYRTALSSLNTNSVVAATAVGPMPSPIRLTTKR